MVRRGTTLDSVLAIALVSTVVAACGGNEAFYDPSSDGGLLNAQCNIQASNYDLSCTVDSDCTTGAGGVPVFFGNFCQAQICLCALDAINRDSASRYASDVADTPLEQDPATCNCPAEFAPCCRANLCIANYTCQEAPPSDAGGE